MSTVQRGERILASLVAALALCGLSTTRATASTPPPDFFGVSAPELYSMSLDGRFTLRDAALTHIQAAGIDTVRTEIGWRDFERTAPVDGVHTYDWQPMYRHIAALAEHGQRLTPMIMAPPAWAQNPPSASACQRRGGLDPAHVDDYVVFIGQVAQAFGRDGTYWRWAATNRPAMPQRPITTYEIWNEPNWDSFWCPEIDPETYSLALAKAADAIHAVDPQATVSMGGLVVLQQDQLRDGHLAGMATRTFLGRATGAVPDLASRIDAVAVHTYWATPADDLRALSLVETWLDEVGLGNEALIVSEYGWRSGEAPGALSEETRAQMIGELGDQLARTNCNVIGEYPHNWISPRLNLANPEDWLGLADPLTGAPLASGLAYAGVIDSYESGSASTQPTLDVCTPDLQAPGAASVATGGAPPTITSDDATGPQVTIKRTSKARAKPVIFSVSATDPSGVSRIEYRLDGGAWTATTGTVSVKAPGTKRHVLQARASDAVGNVGYADSLGWRLRQKHRRHRER